MVERIDTAIEMVDKYFCDAHPFSKRYVLNVLRVLRRMIENE